MPRRGVVSFDRVAELYDESRSVPAEVLRTAIDWALGSTSKGGSPLVLDVGVGTGITLDPLLTAGARVFGVDVSRRMLAKAQAKLQQRPDAARVDLVCCDALHLPFRRSSFDLIIAFNIFGFLSDERAFLLEGRRVSQPGGHLVAAGRYSLLGHTSLLPRYYENYRRHRKLWRRVASRLQGHRLKSLVHRFRQKLAERSGRRLVSLVDKTKLYWEQEIDLRVVLRHLEQRSLPSLWRIPEPTHARIIRQLRLWIEEQRADRLVEKIRPSVEIRIYRLGGPG